MSTMSALAGIPARPRMRLYSLMRTSPGVVFATAIRAVDLWR